MQDKLERFLKAHEENYERALNEIRNGHKDSHWIWYIFPNFRVFSGSEISSYYGLEDYEEAKEYYSNPILKSHLMEISEALLNVPKNDIKSIMDYPDNLKVQSSMTLFLMIDPDNEVFKRVLEKYYNNKEDERVKMFVKTVFKSR